MSKKNKEDQIEFEVLFNELTQLVESMEQGGSSLEVSLRQFERGIELVNDCQKKLEHATLRVQQLMHKEKKEVLVPYDDIRGLEERD